MKTNLNLLFLFVTAIGLLNCSDKHEDAPPPIPPVEEFPLVSLRAVDGLQMCQAEIDATNLTASFAFQERNRLDTVTLYLELLPGYYEVEPSLDKQPISLEEPQQIHLSNGEESREIALLAQTAQPFRLITYHYKQTPVEGAFSGYNCLFVLKEYSQEKLSSTGSYPIEIELNPGYSFEVEPSQEMTFVETSTAASYQSTEKLLVKNQRTGKLARYTLKATIEHPSLSQTPFDIYTGVNLSYWIDPGQGTSFWAFNEEMAERLAQLGYDHVRVPVYESALYHEDGSRYNEFFDELERGIGWCLDRKMKVIIDLHGMTCDPLRGSEEDKIRFYDLWEKMAIELQKYSPQEVAYELFNEVGDATVSSDVPLWNTLVENVIHRIRTVDPERVLFVGSLGNDCDAMQALEIPQGDPNLFLSFHYYRPMPLTHYGFSIWSDFNGIVHYPGKVVERSEFEQLSPEIQSKYGYYNSLSHTKGTIDGDFYRMCYLATEKGARIHCGEYACSNKQGDTYPPRVEWYKDMMDTFEKYNIAHTHWESTLGTGGIFTLHYWDGTPVWEILNEVTRGRSER